MGKKVDGEARRRALSAREKQEAEDRARSAASAEALFRFEFAKRQLQLPGIEPPPLCWWRDPK